MAWKPAYITGEQLGDYLGLDAGEYDPDQLTEWATTASRDVDHFTHRQFGTVDDAEQRRYLTVYNYRTCRWLAEIDDLHSASGLVVAVSGTLLVEGDDFDLLPLNAPAVGRVYERISIAARWGSGPLVMTSPNWGWPAVPAGIVTATKIQGARLSVRPDSPFGVAGSPQVEGGGESRLLAAIDPDARTSARPYVRKWYAR